MGIEIRGKRIEKKRRRKTRKGAKEKRKTKQKTNPNRSIYFPRRDICSTITVERKAIYIDYSI